MATEPIDERTGLSRLQTLTRGEFLKGGGALVVGFSMAGALLGSLSGQVSAKGAPTGASSGAAVPGDIVKTPTLDSWLAVRQNGTVEIYQSKVEIGGGETTAIAQIAADELYLDLSRVTMARVDTAKTPFDPGTFGSQSVSGGGSAVRLAAASARQALLIMAADRLGTTVDQLTIRNGVVSGPAGRGTVTYGQLIGGHHFDVNVNPAAPLKSPKSYTIVGLPIPRLDIPQKLTGANGPHQYLVNVRLPNMVHARFLRPPAFGATIQSMDTAAVAKMPGVVAVLPLTFGPKMKGFDALWMMPEGQFIAVVAETEWQALDALQALAGKVTWTKADTLPTLHTTEQVADYLVSLPVVRTSVEKPVVGNPAATIRAAARKASAVYATPYLTNGPIGPSSAVVDVTSSGATVYSGSQVPFSVQPAVAAVLGLPVDKVTVLEYAASGSYGRGNLDDAAIEAAILSQKLGRPVRVQWMRQEEFTWSTEKTPEVTRLEGAVDGQGNLLAWQSEVWSDTHIVNPGAFFGATYGGGVLPIYDGDHQTTVHYVKSALRKGAMRGLGAWPTLLAHEGFIDELAFLAGMDPVAFRLKNLNDPRAIAVIREAARLAGWTSHTKARANGEGQGISFLADRAAGTYVAEVATVTVDRTTGKVRVKNVAVAHDCGLIVNPNGLRNQIEGGVLQATSWTLKEQLTFDQGTVTSVDWMSYPILRFSEVPRVDISLMNHPELPASGAGEPASMAGGAAILNAFYDATGVRMRATPFTPERVKAVLA